MKSWIPMLGYLFFFLYLSHHNLFKFFHKFAFSVTLLAGILASIFFLEKAVIFFYFLGFLGIYIYSGRRLKKYLLPAFFILSIAIVSTMYLITYGDRIIDYYYLRDILIHRINTQSVGSVMAYHYFNLHDIKGMSGVSSLWAEIFGEKFSSPYSDLIKYYVPESADTSGSLSSFVTGEAYGLFGLFGILLSGILVSIFYSFFESTKKSPVLSIIFVGVYGLYFSHDYVASSFFGFVWPIGLAYNIFPFFIILLLSINIKRLKNEK
ncbi:hypothetical protein ACLPHM_13355 [Paenalcaligenes sp. Me131]|uniref:hypothetical protein n=1 Tax=Paenalcaligenes sp. Me131 TaxID=3392636 RepID=UPI003D2E6E58